MKLTKDQLNKIKRFAKKRVCKNDPHHRIDHIKQTVKLAKYLAKKEKADINKSIVAAWLHDISKHKQNKKIDHATNGAEQAKKFLRKIKIPEKDISNIYNAIKHHNKETGKNTKEAKILWDADKLQGIGPYGTIRTSGYHFFLKENQKQVHHSYLFEEKFFCKRFHTKTAKKIVKKQKLFMKKFNKLYKETENADFK